MTGVRHHLSGLGGAVLALGLAVVTVGCGDRGPVTSPSAAAPASTAVKGGNPTVRNYKVTSSVSSMAAGSTQAIVFTVTNCNEATCPGAGTSDNQDLGYATIELPAGFTGTVAAGSVTASGGKSWTGVLSSGVIQLTPNAPEGQNRLVPGESVQVTFNATAPAICDTYTWNTDAFKAAPDETPFTPAAADPQILVTGCDSCTYSQGHWKNTSAWPVTSLTLGTVSYDQAQLLSIYDQPVVGNGLVSLAHQLITAKLNVANGADASAIASTIADADALIAALVVPPVGNGWLAPSATSALVSALTNWNEGITGPGHCPE